MDHFWKIIFVLQFLLGTKGTIYYDDENTFEEMIDERESDKLDFSMLISGGYHIEDPTFEKYLVSIRTRKATEFFGDNHFCAGTMIGIKMVLTAAHCLMDSRRIKMRPRRLLVVGGTPNRLHHTARTREFQIEKIIVHPEFRRYGAHDIAVIMLRQNVNLEEKNIRIVSVAKARPVVNTTCVTAGWGKLFQNGPYAAKIVYLIFTIQPHELCKKVYGDKYNSLWNLCTTGLNSNQADVCYGDSGGPLMCSNRLAGIISWGAYCGAKGYPTIFTDVVAHNDWLFAVTNNANRLLLISKIFLVNIFSIVVLLSLTI